MGTIDKTVYKLTCPKCSSSETSAVLDKGSGWSGSWWQSSATFLQFDTEWTGGAEVEPTLVSATCKKCGTAATVD